MNIPPEATHWLIFYLLNTGTHVSPSALLSAFNVQTWQLLVSLLGGGVAKWLFHITPSHIRDGWQWNIYSERLVFIVHILCCCCSCCHLCDCFLLRAVNQLTTVCPKFGVWEWEACLACVIEIGFIRENWQLNCHLPLRWFPNYNLFCAVSGNRRIEKQNLFHWQNKRDQDRLGAKESHTGKSSKVLARLEDVPVGKVTQVIQIASDLQRTWLMMGSVMISIPK